MSRVINEVGNKYGKLTVIERCGSNKSGRALWKCLCDCGNITIVEGSKLRNGHTHSCGCESPRFGELLYSDLVGQKFGKLLAIKKTRADDGRLAYLCKCDCGNEVIVRKDNLISHTTSTCGCGRSSSGEIYIENILKDNNVLYETEKTFEELIGKNNIKYRYDFYLPEYNYLIEFDGMQHFRQIPNNYFNRSLEEVQEIDSIKNKYAIDNGYTLVRIPYSELKNLSLKLIFSEKYKVKF